MNKNFFKELRIMDGGMGQELLARGLEPKGTLWSASALLNKNYHQLVLDTHLDFINAGAEIIVTTTFSTKRIKLRENNIEEKFEYLNIKAGEIAQKAKMLNNGVFVAGGLPPQNFVYQADLRKNQEIRDNFYDQAKLINPYIDFFYLEVLSSVNEIRQAIRAIKKFKKPYLIGAHISEGTRLPSDEKISDIIHKIDHDNLMGLMLSCVSPENFELNLKELQSLGLPFGFKLNGFKLTNPKSGYNNSYSKSISKNPNEFLGKRKDLTAKKFAEFAEKFKSSGATILGGCCETNINHINAIFKLKK
ncbi:MAG: homocysteine S-methyltransferase family protein [Bacteroidota bacterium]|nr:homocysteine S-methyltransferase family protein [Bacteroidota bacterium]